MKRGEARLLANSSSDDYISVANLNDAFDGQADFLLLFAGAQSCDEFVGGDAQCVLHRSGGGTGLHLCIADPGASAEFRTCELFEESTPSCKAIIAPPSVCGRFELLGLRRVTPTPGGASQLELRREGRPVMTIDAAAVDLGARRPLRIGGSEKRSYSGEIALVALIIGNVDDHETCLIEDFVLRSLKAAGLRDESDTTLDECG